MGRSRKKRPFFEHVTIADIGSEGKAVARVNEMVVFVPFVIPGDVVDLQVTKKRKSYMEAQVVRIHQFSPDRVDAFCEHFQVCGGCKWQFLPYEKQLYYKQKQVVDQFQRIGKVTLPEVSPIIGSKDNTFYRNKLEFAFSNKRWLTKEEVETEDTISNTNGLGFHIPGRFDKVLDIQKCWLQPPPSNEIRNFIKVFCIENNLSFFDRRDQTGLLRNIVIRTNRKGEAMLIVIFKNEDHRNREKLLNAIAEEFPEIISLIYIINEKGNDTYYDLKTYLYKGQDHIVEEMEGLKFKIGAKSFYQTNPDQAYELYKVARDFAELTGKETVYDLYTGTGTIANFIAKKANKVIGIEYVPEAIEDAMVNSTINDIENTRFFAGDMRDILTNDFVQSHGKPDVIITDPPRAGMHDDVIQTILNAAPQKIVYVSCNPATQARDIKLMDDAYCVEKVQPVDMFPHTHHVENVVLLKKRNN